MVSIKGVVIFYNAYLVVALSLRLLLTWCWFGGLILLLFDNNVFDFDF
jgi:hypothetical protein